MSYRIETRKPEPPHRDLEHGASTSFAIPCYYKEIRKPIPVRHHSRLWHDHTGMPSPNHPDHICQWWNFASCDCVHGAHKGLLGHHERTAGKFGYDGCGQHLHCRDFIDMSKLFPIHLIREGYTEVLCGIYPEIAGIGITGYIDEIDDWIIRVHISAICESAISKMEQTNFSIFVTNGENSDPVMTGKIIVAPAPIPL